MNSFLSKVNPISNKQGITGIGTLIIFIAMILVAAVAAGVIIRTSNVLQQQAYVVGSETRQRIITALEVFAVTANADTETHTTREFDVYTRLRAGSYPLQLATTGFTFTTADSAIGSTLQHHTLDSYFDVEAGEPYEGYSLVGLGTSSQQIADITKDQATESAYLETDGGAGNDSLIIELSNDEKINYSFDFDIDSAGTGSPITVDLLDEHLYDSEDEHRAFLQMSGNITSSNSLDGDNLEVYLSEFPQKPENRECTFDSLIPEKYYCAQFQIGDDDYILDSGEIAVIKYKLKKEHALPEDTEFEVRFIPKRGTITDLSVRTPDTIGAVKLKLWP